jgi:simple sugar transport system substrate-binding protein
MSIQKRPRSRKLLLGLAATTVVVAALASAAVASLAAFPQGRQLRILFTSQSPSSDRFASVYVNGFNAACKVYQVSCEYRGETTVNFTADEMIHLIQNAQAAHPDGLVTTDPAPSGLNPSIKAVVQAGIPVVIVNTGYGQAEPTGALTFIGNQETNLGASGAARLKQAGAKHAVLFTAQPGIPLVDQRNAGFKKAFAPGKVVTVAVAATDLSNTSKMTNILKATMIKDKAVDAVFSVGDLLNPPMLAVRSSLGARAAKIHWASIDVGDSVVKALQNKQMDFAIAQQQYIEGYRAVEDLVFYLRGGFVPARKFTPVGPTYVTPETIASYVQFAKQGLF